MPTGRNSRLLRPTDRSSDATEAYKSHRVHRRTVDSGSLRRSRMFFLRYHRLAKGSRTAYKFHPHVPYRPHGSKVENRYGIHRKASAHYVDCQNNHSPGHDYPPRKPPKRTNVGSPLDRPGHVLHQNSLNPPVRHRPTKRGHGSPTADHATLGRHSGRVPKAEKEEWTNFPNNMNISTLIMKTYIKYWLMAVTTVMVCTNHVRAQEVRSGK